MAGAGRAPACFLAAFRAGLVRRELVLGAGYGVAAGAWVALAVALGSRLHPVTRAPELSVLIVVACGLAGAALALPRLPGRLAAARLADRALGTLGRLESLAAAEKEGRADPEALALVAEESAALLPAPREALARFPFPAGLRRALLLPAALLALAPLILPPPAPPPAGPTLELSASRRDALRRSAAVVRRVFLDRPGAAELAARLERLAEDPRPGKREFLREAARARFEIEKMIAEAPPPEPAAAGRREGLAQAVEAAGRLLSGEGDAKEREADLAAVEAMARREAAGGLLGELARALREGRTAEAELARRKVEALLGRKVREIDRAELEELARRGLAGADPTLAGSGEILLAPAPAPGGADGETGVGAASGAGGGAAQERAEGGPGGAGRGGQGAGTRPDPDPVRRTGFDAARGARESKVENPSAGAAAERARVRGMGRTVETAGSERSFDVKAAAPLSPTERAALREGEERFLREYFETLTGTKDGGRK